MDVASFSNLSALGRSDVSVTETLLLLASPPMIHGIEIRLHLALVGPVIMRKDFDLYVLVSLMSPIDDRVATKFSTRRSKGPSCNGHYRPRHRAR